MILKQELTLFTRVEGVFSEVAARGRPSWITLGSPRSDRPGPPAGPR